MKPVRLLLSLLASLLLATTAMAQPIDEIITAHAQREGFSGTILVRREGRTVYSRSFGLADRTFAVPAAADTRYLVASITKLFTAALILQLRDEGKIDLDAPIRTYLPDYPGEGADQVTVAQLLNHTSGIAQFDRTGLEEALANGIERYQRPQTPAQLLARCCTGPLARPPGTAFDYNNADYIVLGRIVERVTGVSYEQALTQRILAPLGLRETGMARQDRVIPRLASTYFYLPTAAAPIHDLPVYFQNWYAAGGAYATAADVADFADALFGGRLVSASSLERLLAPGLDDYGLGLWSYSFRRGGRMYRVAKRPGSIMGANAVLYRLLDQQATVVILANTNRVDLDVFAQRIGTALVR